MSTQPKRHPMPDPQDKRGKCAVKVPKGWYIVRNGTRIHEGDRFKKQNGHWSKTSDAGRRICWGGIPSYVKHPEYAGIYIRKAHRGRKRK